MIVCQKNVAKRIEDTDTIRNTDIRNTTAAITEDAAARVTAAVDNIMADVHAAQHTDAPVDTMVDVHAVNTTVGEGSSPKKRSERNWKPIRKSSKRNSKRSTNASRN